MGSAISKVGDKYICNADNGMFSNEKNHYDFKS